MKLRYRVHGGILALNQGNAAIRVDQNNFVVAPLARLIRDAIPQTIHLLASQNGLTNFFIAKSIWHSGITPLSLVVTVPRSMADGELVAYVLSKTFGTALRGVRQCRNGAAVVHEFTLHRPAKEWELDLSFNVITDGRNGDKIARAIDSIRRQDIPSYEINLVGPSQREGEWRRRYEGGDIRCIADDAIYRDDSRFPIAKKKNLAIRRSRGRTVVLMHDRIWLSERWYEGLNEHRGAFDIYGCRILAGNGVRYVDKVGMNYEGYPFRKRRMYYLGYGESNVRQYVDGGFFVLNAEQTAAVSFDERLHWMEIEDVDFAAAQRLHGNAVTFDRFNHVHSDFTGHFHLQRGAWPRLKKSYLRRSWIGELLQRTERLVHGPARR